MATSDILVGKWTYRSFHNRAAMVDGVADAALKLIFAEATFTFALSDSTTLEGAIDWDGGGLDIRGTVAPATATSPLSVALIGSGRPNTDTAGWEYDYRGARAYEWPNGVNQIPALVGTVIRAKPHNGSPAGYVASLIAVKQ